MSPDAPSAPSQRTSIDARALRRLILQTAHRAGVGHIGSALSVADIVAVLYGRVLRLPSIGHPDRDRFILSKGHAALAHYSALVLTGVLPPEILDEYCADGGRLGVHPDRSIPGIDFSTGSLGHGLSYGAGAALAARLENAARRAFVLLSDAELNAGATWEAVMFAAHHQLGRLVAIVDLNGQQAFGFTRDVLDLSPVAEKFHAFGWAVVEVDGHDAAALEHALSPSVAASGPPRAVIAHTVFGKGVSFMESRIPWHYLPMTEDQFRRAVQEIERVDA